MINTKKLLAAAALAVISVAGVGAASAQPYRPDTNRHDTYRQDFRQDIRRDDRRDDHARVRQILRSQGMRAVSTPRLVRGDRYVVRVETRHGRIQTVQVNAHNGRVIRL